MVTCSVEIAVVLGSWPLATGSSPGVGSPVWILPDHLVAALPKDIRKRITSDSDVGQGRIVREGHTGFCGGKTGDRFDPCDLVFGGFDSLLNNIIHDQSWNDKSSAESTDDEDE